MMRENIRNSLVRVSRTGWDFAAGELVTLCRKDGFRKNLLTLRWTRDRDNAEGLWLDEAGIRDQGEAMLLFHVGYLQSQGVETVEPDDWFEILGERWDLDRRNQRVIATGPTADNHAVIRVVVRKAVELNKTIDGESFGWGCND